MAPKTPKDRPGLAGHPGSVVELKHEEQRARGAETLLKNKLLTQAFEDMKRNALDHIAASDLHDQDKREELYRFIKVIDAAQKQLKVYLNKGKAAAMKLEEIYGNVK